MIVTFDTVCANGESFFRNAFPSIIVESEPKVKMSPIEQLMRNIMDQYDRKPQGWRVLTDRKGNVLVIGPEVGYRLKLVPVNPREYTGVGVKIARTEDISDVAKGFASYGFRPLTGKETKGLINNLRQGGTFPDGLIKKLLGISPMSTSELQVKKPKAVLAGPVIAHPNLSAISKSQRELETKLTAEAEKLFRRKYPHRAAIYS